MPEFRFKMEESSNAERIQFDSLWNDLDNCQTEKCSTPRISSDANDYCDSTLNNYLDLTPNNNNSDSETNNQLSSMSSNNKYRQQQQFRSRCTFGKLIFVIFIVISCLFGQVLCKGLLPDLSKIPTPPSFIHEPNPDTIYFVIEQSGPSSNASEFNNGLNLKERRFRCQATGYPSVSYRWLKNKKEFNLDNPLLSSRLTRIPGEGSFIISRLSNDDEGTYQCIAENGNGTAIDKEIKFIRTFINLLPVHQETFPVYFGEPFQKECLPPRSVPSARAYWILMSGQTAERRLFQTINFTNVAINEKGTIFFQYVREEDNIPGFFYTCMAENVELKDYKFGNQFNFDVKRDPAQRHALEPYILPKSQYYSPEEIIVLKGQSLELFCIIAGYPDYIPKWSKYAGEIDYTRVTWNTNFKKSIKIDNVVFQDEGTYSCKFDNDRLNKDFTVTVDAAPYWIGDAPKNVNSSEGSDVEFICSAQGRPAPTFTFYKNGNEIAAGDRYQIENSRLIIKNIKKGDKGSGDNAVYQCKAENKHGFVWANFYLNILAFAPVVLQGPGNLQTVTKRNVTFECKVFGSPRPTVVWSSSQLLGAENKDFYTTGVDYDGVAKLHLYHVQRTSEGQYSCKFENLYGNAVESGKLTVRNATVVKTTDVAAKEIGVGTPLELPCKAEHDANLPVKYTWLLHGRPVEPSERLKIDSSSNSLSVPNPNGYDSGDYTCAAETELDTANHTVRVMVKDVPPSPQGVTVKCSKNRAVVSFYYEERSTVLAHAKLFPRNSAAADHWIIQYTIDPDEPDAWDTYFSEITGLQNGLGQADVDLFPFGKFAFRVLARNHIGSSVPAYPITVEDDVDGRCVTLAKAPLRNPANVAILGNTENSLIINWEPVPRRDWYGPNFAYVVQYKPSGDETESFKNLTIDDPYRDSVTIDGVPTYKEYDVQVWSKNEQGPAAVAPEMKAGRSGESAPSAAPGNFRVLNLDGPSTASFAWDPVDPSKVNGEFKGYKVKHWSSSRKRTTDPNVKEAYFDSQASGGTIYDLKPNKKNYAQIMVYNNYGDGPPSETVEFNMPEGVPTPVQDVSVFPLSDDEIAATWDAPREMNGNFSGYNVKVCQVKNDKIVEETCMEKTVGPDNATESRIKGLEPDTPYRVEIRGKTKAGLGDPVSFDTNTTHFFDEPTVPLTPTIENVEIGHDHINVTWKPGVFGPGSKQPPGDEFYFKYRAEGEDEWTLVNDTTGSNGLTISLTDLKPATKYEIKSVSVHDGFASASSSHFYTTAGGPTRTSASGWLIAIIVAIIILVILLIIVCLVVRSRGAKYPVSEKEKEQGREPMLKDDRGFGEYSKPDTEDEKRSLATESLKPESETDSMAEYGDGETGRFTEDGSFIGQYGAANRPAQVPAVSTDRSKPNLSTFV